MGAGPWRLVGSAGEPVRGEDGACKEARRWQERAGPGGTGRAREPNESGAYRSSSSLGPAPKSIHSGSLILSTIRRESIPCITAAASPPDCPATPGHFSTARRLRMLSTTYVMMRQYLLLVPIQART